MGNELHTPSEAAPSYAMLPPTTTEKLVASNDGNIMRYIPLSICLPLLLPLFHFATGCVPALALRFLGLSPAILINHFFN